MPNWCWNRFTIMGDADQIKEFKRAAKGERTDLSLDNLCPMPKELEGTVSPDDDSNWYTWRVSQWGTKWDVEATLVDETENLLIYEFDSAWSPPVAWLAKVAKDNPELDFWLKYEEESAGFMGIAKASKGKVDDQWLDTN